MSAFVKRLLIMLFIFGVSALILNMTANKLIHSSDSQRNIVAGRITAEIEAELGGIADGQSVDTSDITNRVFYSKKKEWEQLYGEEYCPEKTDLFLFSSGRYSHTGGKDMMVYGIYADDEMIGVVRYSFASPAYERAVLIMNVSLVICVLAVFIYSEWIRRKLLIPFNKLSDYPERLSKGEFTEKLPESDDRFFGKYIWGMNMLSDKLEHDRELIRRLTLGREQFITALVHGIKTPAANIKLYSEAIATGLYAPDGKINDTDAELAEKIEKQADEIERIVTDVMDTGAEVIYDYDPDAEPFYSHRIEEYIREEYSNRLKIGRIPFNTVSDGDPMIKSDIGGVFRIIRQIMDNALKYGDGTGITLKLEKREEGHFITIANNGIPLPDTELPFVWKSLWRGSNSAGIKGSGVGLYEARFIARKMGGDLFMRTGEGTTEVTLFLPK